MKKLLSFIFMGVPLLAVAQNPVIRDQFAADPTARVFNNKVYRTTSCLLPDKGRTGSVWQTTMCSLLRT